VRQRIHQLTRHAWGQVRWGSGGDTILGETCHATPCYSEGTYNRQARDLRYLPAYRETSPVPVRELPLQRVRRRNTRMESDMKWARRVETERSAQTDDAQSEQLTCATCALTLPGACTVCTYMAMMESDPLKVILQ
jgi:hypothetical protein